MEMAFFEQLQNHKYLKHCALKLWFKDSGGTTCKNFQNVLKQRFGSFSFALKPKFDYNLTTF